MLASAYERAIEGALGRAAGRARSRPDPAREQSLLLLEALRRGRAPDHVLLLGWPWLGNTSMLRRTISTELGAQLRITSADRAAAMGCDLVERPARQRRVHRWSPPAARPAEEMLTLAMEDFRVTPWSEARGHRHPLDTAVDLGLRDHPGRASRRPRRCATGSASPPGWTSSSPSPA